MHLILEFWEMKYPFLLKLGRSWNSACLTLFSWPPSVACLKSTVLEVVVSGRKTDDRKRSEGFKRRVLWVTVSEKFYVCMEREGTLLEMREL